MGLFSSLINYQANDRTNKANKEIAEMNLEYQKERNKIEDARYEEETSFNRAWAQDDREYERALQQQIFDREDTALERQADSLSKMGINPLSQNMQGLGAGQAVTPAVAPTSSTRGGTALNNDFKKQAPQMAFDMIGPMLSLADTLNGVKTGQYQRDALALQNDKQFLENLETANGLGINYQGYIPYQATDGKKGYRNEGYTFYGKNGEKIFDSPDYQKALGSKFKKNYLDSVPKWVGNLEAIGSDSVYKSAEQAVTKVSDLFSKGVNNLFDGDKSISDMFKDKSGKFNPFSFLYNMFF